MTETVLEQHFRDRVESVRRIACAGNGNGMHERRFYEDLAHFCIQLSVSGRELLVEEYKRAVKDHFTFGWLRERRQAFEALRDNYVQLAESIRAAAVQACNTAGAPRGKDLVAELDEAIRALVTDTQNMLERWLVGSDEENAAAAAAAARGEGIDIDEAFAEIAGVDVATWRKRVADRRAGPQS